MIKATNKAIKTISTNGVGTPKNVPLPIRANCSGRPEIETPFVNPIAMPLNNVRVAKVANIGVMFKTAIRSALMPPQIKPSKIPARHAIKIHRFVISPSSLIFFVRMYAANSAARLDVATIDKSIPPVSIDSMTAIERIATSGI